MSKLIIPLLFFICCFYYSCSDDCTVVVYEKQPFDPCENINPVACSFEFREGKWIEIQDSISAIYVEADTVWFKEDSLISWSFQGEEYQDLTGYFIGNYLFSQTWNSGGQGAVAPRRTFTKYIDSTEVFTIEWTSGLQSIDYRKLD